VIVSTAQTICREIYAAIDEQIDRRVASVVEGVPTTVEQYRKTVGEIAGLRTARGFVEEAFKNLIDPQRTA